MKRKVCIVAYDWRNMFENEYEVLIDRLKRDRLDPENTEILLIDWSTKTYYQEKKNIHTQHIKGHFGKTRWCYDMLSVFVVPYYLIKHRFRPDFFYTLNFPFVFSAWYAKWVHGAKVLLYLSARPQEIAKTRGVKLLRVWYHRVAEFLAKPLVDAYFANGEGTKDYLLRIGVKEKHIRVMYKDVISRDMVHIKSAKAGVITKQYHLGEEKKNVLTVGRLVAEKNHAVLFERIAEDDNLVLIVVGSGELEQELKKKVRDLGIQKRVIFVGQMSREEIWNFYKDADVFVLASVSEGNPNVIREAMYMEVPVIANKIPAVEAMANRSDQKLLEIIDIEDPQQFAAALEFCFSAKKDSMISHAKQHIVREISVDSSIFELI
ncbi:glycosyltransferase [Candidatus Nomurabacteria bacterium]|nr:glycosyltransferase [Candidatus Nomurabacteria bacterium]